MRAQDNRTLDKQQESLLGSSLADLDGRLPLGREQCGRAVRKAWERSSLDFRVVLSRFLWLVSPARPETEGIRLFEHSPSLSEADLAEAIVHPRKVVLAVIRARTGLDETFLARIYEAISSKGNPDDYGQIADLTEERILQEMKWWLTDLRFPEYYLRNTPAELMARQIMLNRFYELPGLRFRGRTRR